MSHSSNAESIILRSLKTSYRIIDFSIMVHVGYGIYEDSREEITKVGHGRIRANYRA